MSLSELISDLVKYSVDAVITNGKDNLWLYVFALYGLLGFLMNIGQWIIYFPVMISIKLYAVGKWIFTRGWRNS